VQGDVVTFVGVLSSFTSGWNCLLIRWQVTPAQPSIHLLFRGQQQLPVADALVIPFNITNSGYASMNTSTAGRYVQLTNVFFGTNAGNYIQTGFYSVTNKSGQSFKLWFSGQDLDTLSNIFPASRIPSPV